MPKYCITYAVERNGGGPVFYKKEMTLDKPIQSMEEIGILEREMSATFGGHGVHFLGCTPLAEE